MSALPTVGYQCGLDIARGVVVGTLHRSWNGHVTRASGYNVALGLSGTGGPVTGDHQTFIGYNSKFTTGDGQGAIGSSSPRALVAGTPRASNKFKQKKKK